MVVEALRSVLTDHERWLSGSGGQRANLRGADLYGATLREADLYGANLYGANLREANLREADLRGANLYGANLREADLYGANLYGANLHEADLRGANLPHFQIPQEGELIVYKKLGNRTIAKLRVPPDAKRTASLVGRKCRAEYVEVLEGGGNSSWDVDLAYAQGETVRPNSYDPDVRVECTEGIHFFLTREEAEQY